MPASMLYLNSGLCENISKALKPFHSSYPFIVTIFFWGGSNVIRGENFSSEKIIAFGLLFYC